VTANILRADWIRAAALFVLTVAVVGAALAFCVRWIASRPAAMRSISGQRGANAVARPFCHSARSSTGRLANLAPNECTKSGANDGSGGPAVLVVVSAAAT